MPNKFQPNRDRALAAGRAGQAVSFDTRVYPLNIRVQCPKVFGGGGTSFQAIEEFARTLRKR